MKIVNIIGGIGNQMFQYAFAKSLQVKFPDESILVDISHFSHYNLHSGFQINDVYKNANIPIATPSQIKEVTWYLPNYRLSRLVRAILPKRGSEYIENRDYVFDERPFRINSSCYYEGYWQSPLYFDGISSIIKDMFAFPSPQDENLKWVKRMESCNSVAIHVRRGDYVNAKSFAGICDVNYYKKAIDVVMRKIANPEFYIFSNDIEWCVQFIAPMIKSHPLCYVTNNTGKDSFWDIFLMSKCHALILANSSFSWWSAYLNSSDSSLIVTPGKWVNRKYEQDIYMNQWIKI